MSNGRTFMLDLLDACKQEHWSVRPKDPGFVVSPPRAGRRPGFEAIFVFAPKDNHERRILATRLKQAGLPISLVENEIVKREDKTNMTAASPPKQTTTALISGKAVTVNVEPEVSTTERIRRNVTKISDLCTEVVVDLDKLEKDNERVNQLKQLLKGLGD